MQLKNTVLSILKTLLITGSTYAVAKGWFSENVSAEIITAVTGGVVAIWDALDEHFAENKK